MMRGRTRLPGAVLLLVLSAISGTVSLTCYSCSDALNLSECNSTKECDEGQVCYKRRQFTSQVKFDLGCIDKEECGRLANIRNSSGNANMSVDQTSYCYECCSKDGCNDDLCEYHPNSFCKDDNSIDCAKWNSVFSICEIKSEAKKFCQKFCNLCNLVDGKWAPWSPWSKCDVNCGKGLLLRHRTCSDPEPQNGGEDCPGKRTESAVCELQPCPVDGKWIPWSPWSKCDVTCGKGLLSRHRTCSDPAPQHGGDDCPGKRTESKFCELQSCPVNGGWSNWSDWGSCSSTCDFGIQRRDRSCTNPYPSRFGDHCFGDTHDYRICFQPPCANGGWTSWENWSSCSVTCGGGIKSKSRSCTNPKPSLLGEYCHGNQMQAEQCGNILCRDRISAYSVYQPNVISGEKRLTFSNTMYQHGHDFSMSTGTFTCSIAGTYHFSVTLVKKRSSTRVDRVYCYLYKGSSQLIYIHVDPTDDDTDKGHAAVSQSIVIHLNKGDTVYLSTCNGEPSTYMESWSSFTGFLLYPDN